MAEPVRFKGFGRPLSEESLDRFQETFYESIGDIPAALVMTRAPGIYYAEDEWLNINSRLQDSFVKTGMDTRGVIDALISNEVLDEHAANTGISSLKVKAIDLSPKSRNLPGGGRGFPLYVYIEDVEDIRNVYGYQVLNEKLSVRRALDVERDLPDTTRAPRHKAKIGVVACERGSIGDHLLSDIKIAMNGLIDLAKIGELSARFRKYKK